MTGSGFDVAGGAHCRFGATAGGAAAVVLTSTLLRCMAPAKHEGIVSVRVSNNAVDASSDEDVTYAYLPKARLFAVVPTLAAASGFESVTLSGSSFTDSPLLSCAFGGLASRATFLSSSRVVCTTPVSSPKIATVQVGPPTYDPPY